VECGICFYTKNAFSSRKMFSRRQCPAMSIAEIRKLPLQEKLQILEAIWDDFSARVDEVSVSPAVRDILDERIERVRSGAAEVHDWDRVKFSIGKP
jgi:putative addiction module component (TIGR02574 family)